MVLQQLNTFINIYYSIIKMSKKKKKVFILERESVVSHFF